MAATFSRTSLAALLIVALTPALASPLTIVAPANGTRVAPGQSVTVVVTADASETLDAASAGFGAQAIVDLLPVAAGRFEGRVTVPTNAVGPVLVVAAGRLSDGRLSLDNATLLVEPGLVRLLNISAPTGLSSVGQVERVEVSAAFEDAVLRDVSGGDRGTTYASSDPAILGVHPDGYLQARSAGQAVLTVTNRGMTSSTVISVVVPSPPDNRIPVPVPGPDRVVQKNQLVELDGTASSDADGDPLEYRWHQEDGILVRLVDDGTARPKFYAPYVTEPSVVTLSLTVRDRKGATSFPVLIRITVTP